jgi:hypothetical protein
MIYSLSTVINIGIPLITLLAVAVLLTAVYIGLPWGQVGWSSSVCGWEIRKISFECTTSAPEKLKIATTAPALKYSFIAPYYNSPPKSDQEALIHLSPRLPAPGPRSGYIYQVPDPGLSSIADKCITALGRYRIRPKINLSGDIHLEVQSTRYIYRRSGRIPAEGPATSSKGGRT